MSLLAFASSICTHLLCCPALLILRVSFLPTFHWIIIFDNDPGVEFSALDVLKFLRLYNVLKASFITISFQFFQQMKFVLLEFFNSLVKRRHRIEHFVVLVDCLTLFILSFLQRFLIDSKLILLISDFLCRFIEIFFHT